MKKQMEVEECRRRAPVANAPVDRRTFLGAASASAALFASGVGLVHTPAQAEHLSTSPRNGLLRENAVGSDGLSLTRLGRMHEVMAGYVDQGDVPGMVTAVSRGDDVHVEALGTKAAGGADRMRRNSIFRIASITKPITAAAAMILVEECVLRLDDPVDPWLPELADRRVLKRLGSPLDDTVPAKRPITLRDLLTFKLGIGAIMAYPGAYPIQQAMDDAGISPSADLPVHPPDEMMKRYGSVPLAHQPGEGWLYNCGSDILGVLISRASGRTLGEFLRERLFDPLGMTDTGFFVPEDKLDRLTTAYRTDHETGELVVFDDAREGRFSRPPAFESGAGGLVSTVDDYVAFSKMMLNKGVYDGQRLLSRPSIELMTTDHLTERQRADSAIFFGGNRGWGFGMAVYTQRDDLSAVPGRFGWDGGYGTSAYVDPNEGLIGILLTQKMMDSPEAPPVYKDFWTSAYQAIDD